ncbi:MAG: hypothetical protein LC796_00955 [Acidobacteria bacterium]|nr:hypothetical protein [Acidobacteriota bacterium]
MPRAGSPQAPRLEWILFFTAVVFYAATRFLGISRYPVFFFCDEALQGNLAWELLHNRFRDHTGTFLPPYFLNDRRWAVSLSVYMHLLPVALFGKSVTVIRATSAAVSVLGAAAGGLALKEMRNRFWWAVPLLVAGIPLFFVHARLGFETAMMASFYFCFLWAYFVYRGRNPRWLFAALAFGAAVFYAYTAGQGVMLVTGAALLISDLRYHLRQRKALLAGALLFSVLLAAPYVRYRRLHPGVVQEQLAVLDSYWTHPIPLYEKLRHFGKNYAAGLDPRYWFRPNAAELPRHRMDTLPFLPVFLAPLMVLGMGVCLWKAPRSALHRAVLISPLGVPFSAAVAELQILRLMAMVVPATLLSAVAIDQLLRWLARLRVPYAAAAAACAAALAFQSGKLTRDALVDGPTWSHDYGLYGMQWGAPQIFDEIRRELPSHRAPFLLSSAWSNNPREFVPFFLPASDQPRVQIADIRAWDQQEQPLSGQEIFIMTPEEYGIATGSGKFLVSPPVRTIPYPDGKPGFQFVRVRYVPNAREIFAAEKLARAVLQEAAVSVGPETWTFRHSRTDMGSLEALFDGRPETITRGLEANPFIFEIRFPSPRPVGSVSLSLGAMDQVRLTLKATSPSGEERIATATAPNRPALPSTEVRLPGGSFVAAAIRIEIADGNGIDPTHIEIGEMRVK